MYSGKTTGFGSPFASGSATPAFGSSGFGQTIPATGGLFGQANTGTSGGLFGGASSATAFGTQQTSGFNFSTPSSSGGGLFGPKPTAVAGPFGTPAATSSNAFGFGGTAGFGTTTSTASGGLFGATGTTGGGLFGASSPFGGGQAQAGTVVKFNPPPGTDTMVKNGVSTNISTKHQCVTAMKEYENKSLEELRMEDYTANRKGKQAGAATGFGFGTPAATTQAGFSFGQNKPTGFGTSTGFGSNTSTGSTSLFGQQTPAQPAATGLFGQTKPMFGSTPATQSTGFGFGTATSTGGGGLFGQQQQPQQNKPLFGSATTQSGGLFGANTSTFGQPAASTGFTGFGNPAQTSGGLFGSKPPAFGATTTSVATGFNFGSTPAASSASLFNKPFGATGFGATPATGFGATPQFGGTKPAFGLTTSSAAPSFNFGAGGALGTGGTGLFGNNTLSKPAGFGNLGVTGSTGGIGFGSTGFNPGGTAQPLGLGVAQSATNPSELTQQTLLALKTQSPYGDSPLFWNLKESSVKREEVLKPTNPAAQKAVLANQHKVSPRPMAKIKPKALSGVMNRSKAQIFEGLEDEEFSFGNDTFQPRKSVKKLTLRKSGADSGTPSRATSVNEEPVNVSALQDEENFRGRHSPAVFSRRDEGGPENIPETETIIRSKGIPDKIQDTPNKDPNMDDTMAILNSHNSAHSASEPSVPPTSRDDPVDISIISRDDSVADESILDDRPMTPPPPHPAGLVLSRPGYYTIPSLDAIGELVDDGGHCYVEDLTIGREGYGSIFFPGFTDVTNMNLDEMVFFRRKEVIVYPDEDNKPAVGEGLNKKAEITLDYVWPRDKSVGTPIKSPEKLKAMKWLDKIEETSMKLGAKFIDYRPETGSWVFEVKHFSKYGLMDDSDDEDVSEQDKKRLRTLQQQQMAVQKQKIAVDQQTAMLQKGPPTVAHSNGQMARFTIGTDDDESEASSAMRNEVPMGDDDNQMSELSQGHYYGDMQDDFERVDEQMEVREDQPSSHRLATRMGVDARNMQVMKASFFGDEDGQVSSLGGQMFSRRPGLESQSPLLRQQELGPPSAPSIFSKSKYMSSPVKLVNLPQKELVKDRGLFSPRLITPEPIRASQPTFHPPVKEYMLLASGMTSQDYQRKVVGTRVSRTIPAVEESVVYNNQHLLVDAGLFMGRSFRVGWGPGWTLAHSGNLVQPSEHEGELEQPASAFNLFTGSKVRHSMTGESHRKVNLQKLNVADHLQARDQTVLQNHREMLEIQLTHSRSDREGECPVFTPTLGVDALHQYAERNADELENMGSHPDEPSIRHMGMVWDLCVALWGNMPEFKDSDISKDSYMYHTARREAVSRWLSSVSKATITKEVQENKYKEEGHLAAILSCLTGRRIGEACQLAVRSGDHRLALLLAQAVSNYIPRQMVARQLEEWIELAVENNISEPRLKIYSLLSGQLVLTSSSMTINTCEDLDWKRCLAIHLWFSCQANAPVQEAVEFFERAFRGSGDYSAYAQPPLPPYLELEEEEVGEDVKKIQDTCYQLLSLYCKRHHPIEQILNPVTSTPSQLDFRLSWHLNQVLQSLSYQHISQYRRASVHMNFAAHLESLGLWEWAVFVALHLDNPVSRQATVQSILNRHIELSTEDAYMEKEYLLMDKLLVPSSWIHHAKALRAKYEGQTEEEAWHLLKAGHWNKSHDILMRHIAPDAIIQERLDYIKNFLQDLSAPPRCNTILDWHISGKVYLDYITICEAIADMSNSTDVDYYELDHLLPEVKSLCTKVSSLTCRNSKDRLCQSEMAKKAASFLRLILTLQAEAKGEKQPPVRLLAPYISNLPMPEDYALHELRALTRSYMMEQTV